ncbi:MAG: ferric reductase-like transmembrane domain-containing protein [Arenimonas sp.]|nr:ferric reductase-like transmembrane domain-containing protein [Rhizobium sp.]MBW8447476.1 ferric reductase-like transmembrane domain-containing protein [Arenimonas sp.]
MSHAGNSPPWALSGKSLVVLYVVLTAGPVLLASFSGGLQSPTIYPVLARATGVAALAMFLMQFATSGRFEIISGRIGLDRTMGFHRLAATGAILMLALHLLFFLFRGRDGSLNAMWERFMLYMTMPGLRTGVIAAALAVLLVITGRHLRGRIIPYQAWRLSHGIAAVIMVALALHHAFTNARFMADPFGATAILAVALIALSSLLVVYVWRPVQAFRPGFRVERARALSPTVAELVLTTDTPERFPFDAGQFAWLTIGRRHTVTDNPFSIASAPSDLPRLRFLIRNAGDMTSRIADIAPGTAVGVDGPHGSFTLHEAGPGPLLFLAGGIGIAPVLGLLGELSQGRDRRPIRLIAAARSSQDHIARSEINALMAGLDFEAIFLADTDGGEDCEFGTCRGEHVSRLLHGLAPAETTAFVCGPPPMMESAVAILLQAGIPTNRIVMERFDFDAGNDAVCAGVRHRFIALMATVFASVLSVALIAAT